MKRHTLISPTVIVENVKKPRKSPSQELVFSFFLLWATVETWLLNMTDKNTHSKVIIH